MKIQIVKQLKNFTKKVGYSLEELAGKFKGLTQGVTKWERCESYPETNSMICLAHLNLIERDQYDYAQ